MPEYGSIFTNDGATGTAANAVLGIDSTSWTKVTGFTAKGPGNGIGVNADIDELEVRHDAVYCLFSSLSFFGPANTEVKFAILRDDVNTIIETSDYLAMTGTFPTALALGDHLELDAGDRMALGVQFGAGSGQITIQDGRLGVHRVS